MTISTLLLVLSMAGVVVICVRKRRRGRAAYYFRGTVSGFEGGPNAQRFVATCTSRDPLVATTFATHSRSFGGDGVVLVATDHELLGIEMPGAEWLSELEVEVVFTMLPAEFERRAILAIPVDVALAALLEMSFPMNRHIPTHELLSYELRMSREHGHRLTERKQIREFVKRAKRLMAAHE